MVAPGCLWPLELSTGGKKPRPGSFPDSQELSSPQQTQARCQPDRPAPSTPTILIADPQATAVWQALFHTQDEPWSGLKALSQRGQSCAALGKEYTCTAHPQRGLSAPAQAMKCVTLDRALCDRGTDTDLQSTMSASPSRSLSALRVRSQCAEGRQAMQAHT